MSSGHSARPWMATAAGASKVAPSAGDVMVGIGHFGFSVAAGASDLSAFTRAGGGKVGGSEVSPPAVFGADSGFGSAAAGPFGRIGFREEDAGPPEAFSSSAGPGLAPPEKARIRTAIRTRAAPAASAIGRAGLRRAAGR